MKHMNHADSSNHMNHTNTSLGDIQAFVVHQLNMGSSSCV